MDDGFWAKVGPADARGCRPWLGARRNGYGVVKRDGKVRQAHRVAWELIHGAPAPPTMEVMHTCDNQPCCAGAHLVLGTHAANMADRAAKGRGANRRLGPDDVRTIRARHAAGTPMRVLAAAYGVTETSVENVIARRTWRHVA